MNRRLVSLATGVLAWMAIATPVTAQTRPGFSIGLTIAQHRISADSVTGSQSSIGLVAAVGLTPTISIEGEITRPLGVVSRSHTGTSISFADTRGLSRDEAERTFVVTRFTTERRTTALVSAGVAFQPAQPIGRFTPRFFAGISNHRVREVRRLEHLSLPPGVTLEQVNRAMAPVQERTRDLGGLTIGGSLAVRLTDHLSLAPDLRYDYGSIGDEINNALRGSIRALWGF